MAVITERQGAFSPVKCYSVKSGKLHVQGVANGTVKNGIGKNIISLEIVKAWILQCVAFFKRVFLPQGYPKSVTEEYVKFQLWDTIQEFTSSVFKTWTTHATLTAMGVGDQNATALASTMTLLMSEGSGLMAKVGCLWIKGDAFHRNNKKWRFFGDMAHNTINLVRILMPLLPSWLIPIVFCITSMGHITVDVAAKSTRAVVIAHLARQNNTADVTDKEWIQSTAAKLIAIIPSICLLNFLNNDYGTILTVYVVYVTIHLSANYRLMKTLQMRTLNEARALICIKQFIQTGNVPTIREVNEAESVILGYGITDVDVCGYRVQLGAPLRKALIDLKEFNPSTDLESILNDFKEISFLIALNCETKVVNVILREEITPIQMLEAYFRAVITARLANKSSAGNLKALSLGMDSKVTADWMKFIESLKKNGFHTEPSLLKCLDWRVQFKSD